jgi:carbonic anhydrase/acetyltransferase-like protein (isoleucine patch superfamily)
MNPNVHPSCFIAAGAFIIGNVTIERGCGVWFGAVIRADLNSVRIGEGSNIQDHAVIHVSSSYPAIIGKNVSLAHGSIVHGARIGDNTLIGMHATVLNGAEIGAGSLIGANTLVKEGMKIPPGSLVVGLPGKIIRSEDENLSVKALKNAEIYHRLRDEHKASKYIIYKS